MNPPWFAPRPLRTKHWPPKLLHSREFDFHIPSADRGPESRTWNLRMSRGLPAFFKQFWLHLRKNFRKNLQRYKKWIFVRVIRQKTQSFWKVLLPGEPGKRPHAICWLPCRGRQRERERACARAPGAARQAPPGPAPSVSTCGRSDLHLSWRLGLFQALK